MKIVMISGSHPRHLFLVRKIASTGLLSGVIFMRREKFNRQLPESIAKEWISLYKHHFQLRTEMEYKYFGDQDAIDITSSIAHIFIEPRELNEEVVEDFIRNIGADMLISYGPNIIKPNILGLVNDRAYNLHGGLSPYYKGSATLFWPFYFLEPNFAGTTFHQISMKIDGGNIIHHSVPTLCRGDCMHEVSCKAIVKASEDIEIIVKQMAEGKKFEGIEQKKNGKLFLVKDWRPEHLRLIYETYNDKIVDLYLDGKIGKNNKPELIVAV